MSRENDSGREVQAAGATPAADQGPVVPARNTLGSNAAVFKAEQLGHQVAYDPPAILTRVHRWTCRQCGRAVLVNGGVAYGSAITDPCEGACPACEGRGCRYGGTHELASAEPKYGCTSTGCRCLECGGTGRREPAS